jgi:hypothetical protein
MLAHLLSLLLLAQPSLEEKAQCPLDRLSASDRTQAGVDLFEGRAPTPETPFGQAVIACATEQDWDGDTVEAVTRGVSIRLLYDQVTERFTASGMPLDRVHAWFQRQPPSVQLSGEITSNMIASASADLIEAGVPPPTIEAQVDAIGVAIYALVQLHRLQADLPQSGS